MKLENVVGIDFSKSSHLVNEDKSEYVSCLGAMLDPVDFVPKQHADAAKQKQQSKYFKLIVVGALALSGILVAYPLINMSAKKLNKTKLEKEIEDNQDIQKIINEAADADSKYLNATTIFSKTTSYTYLLNVLLEEIEDAMPKGSFASSFSYSETGISLTMTANNIEEVGQFIINAGKCALIDKVEVSSFRTDATLNGKGSYQYSMNITPTEIDISAFLNKKNVPTEDTVKEILGLNKEENSKDTNDESEEQADDKTEQ